MKIKKNLSDNDMLKASGETVTPKENKTVIQKSKAPFIPVALPEDILIALDKEAFNLRIKLKQKGTEDVKWKISLDSDKIILKPLTKEKK